MFYDRFLALCQEKGVKPQRACIEAGLSRGLAAKWKSTGTEKPSADALEKMSVYFSKSIEEILFGEQKEKPSTVPGEEQALSDIELLMAYRQADEVTRELIRRALKLQ